jgi:hypothetical protein
MGKSIGEYNIEGEVESESQRPLREDRMGKPKINVTDSFIFQHLNVQVSESFSLEKLFYANCQEFFTTPVKLIIP